MHLSKFIGFRTHWGIDHVLTLLSGAGSFFTGHPSSDHSLCLGYFRTSLTHTSDHYHQLMLWAVCCLCDFRIPVLGEFPYTSPAGVRFDPSRHLSSSDVTIDNLIQPSVMCIHLKSCTTGAGVDWSDPQFSLSGDGNVSVPSVKGVLPRSSFLLARWLASYSTSFCWQPAQSFPASRSRSFALFRPFISDWRCCHGRC
jgi:hypothetical protein